MSKKNRKWSNLEGQIPDEPVPLTEREIKVRLEADKLRGHTFDTAGQPVPAKTMLELAQEYASLEEEEAFEERAHKERSVQFDALKRVIWDELEKVLELSGQDMWRGEGQTFSPNFSPIPVVTDRTILLDWIKTTGLEDLLDISAPRLKSLVVDALNTELAATMTPAERAALKPGEAASGQPPPGVAVFLRKSINRRATKS